jgi:guanylate kinase
MQSFLKSNNIMMIISSPSGAGKSSLTKHLLKSEQCLRVSISFTTRAMRLGEKNGEDYHFIDITTFQQMIENGEFIEYAEVYGHYYGTPKYSLMKSNDDIIFDIDWQGAKVLKERMPEDVVSIYILPPSMTELEKRLRIRNQDPEEIIDRRMSQATSEIRHYHEYDYVIINDDFNESLEKLKSILHAERLKRVRQESLAEFVKTLC